MKQFKLAIFSLLFALPGLANEENCQWTGIDLQPQEVLGIPTEDNIIFMQQEFAYFQDR